MSLLRYLAAGLAHRWGEFPRSEKVRVVLFAVSVPLAGLVAWQTATPSDDLTASMRSLTDKRAYAQEPARRDELVPFDHETVGKAPGAPERPSAKVTIESRPTADAKGADSAANQHVMRPEASTVRGGVSGNAGPLFRKDGARGESSIAEGIGAH